MTEKRFKEAHLPDKNGSTFYPNLVNPEPVKNLYPKKLAFLLFISFTLITLTSNAKNYYIAASGSDANTGLSAVAAWKTIAKINASFSTFLAGDSILFKRGDTFYGTITIAKTGTSGHPLVFSCYGTGAKPVVTGFTTISGWTNEGNGIYSKVITSAALTNMVTVDGVQYAMGRYPDASYLSYETFSTNTSITDNTLGTATNWAGAEAVIRKNDWTIDRSLITNHSGNTLTYTTKGSSQSATANFGYFIQNDLRTLTKYGEWYHNTSTGKFYMYFGSVDPSTKTVKVATINNLVYANGNFDYITLTNIAFNGSIDIALNFQYSQDYCIIQNNDISFVGGAGINFLDGCTADVIDNNTISYCNRSGIVCNASVNSVITNNIITNIGQFAGQAIGSNDQYEGVYTRGDGVTIRYNTIRNTGYNGITLKYTGAATIQYNLIDSACTVLDDGGGIYTPNPNTSVRLLDHNIILNTIGNSDGTDNTTSISTGIYLDEEASNVKVTNNTLANIAGHGIKLHRASSNTLTDNTSFNDGNGIDFEDYVGNKIRTNSMRRNIFFSKTATQYPVKWYTVTNDINLFGTADSNYYSRPINDNLVFNLKQPSPGYMYKSVTDWNSFSAQDAHSRKSVKTITNVSDIRFEYNATNIAKTITLDAKYLGSDSTIFNGTITLAPYTSAVLIKSGATAGNKAPVANGGTSITITLPTNSVNLTGSGTDADGTINSYSWAKISGPSSGTIAAPTAAVTTANNLVQGVYKFELTVTDNIGAIAKDTIQVTVNAPTNKAPSVTTGADKLINLPVNTVSLTGTATDADGTISSYAWVKISGPSSGVIATANAANTAISNLTQGIYKFELTVTDNSGAIAKDTIVVTVNATPVANAGTDKLISLPTNIVSLTGTATDADGTISSYSWVKISGPSSVTIATANAATTAVNNLVQGVYQFELTVTDNNGGVSKDTVIVTVNAKPLVNAGLDKLISLPTNTITLSGIATDADGTISSYLWVKISGSSATISTSNAASTMVNNLLQGIYQFELTVADNNGAVSKDTVIVTVNAAPAVNAGADKLISLPTNTITLIGTATDADGTISSYSWAKISGPSSVTLATANAATTTVNNLVQGVYQFELTVTDNSGAVSKDTVIVTVNAKPLVNAGLDKLISLPTNTITLTGTATDADGSISSYSWVKISGPSSVAIATANASTTAVSNMAQGIYQFELTASDNNGAVSKDTVQVTVNAKPLVNAGADKLISLPTNTTTLTGTATDADGSISSYLWAKISGPSSVTIASANASTTTVNNLAQGVYQFELTVSDNNGAVSKDTVQVTVNAKPLVNAGADKLISLPTNTITLTGTATDADGSISSYSWVKISGPSSVAIATANASTTTVNNLAQGVYQFELTVSDNNGAVSKDTVQVTVNAKPLVNAGADKLISLPTNTTTLTGTATDADGSISSYSWVKISGPSSVTIATANASTTTVNNLVQGVYQFELTVTDNNGAVSKDTVQVTVNAAPLVNAGLDKLISLPTNTTTLTGTATDADGTISNYSWVKISGPSSVTIATANAATTAVSNMAQGVYQFELTVTDNSGAVSKDTVQVTVNAAPLVNAGLDKLISLPTNTTTLTGIATDADGTISSYSWVKISGPSSVAIATANASTTAASNLAQGVYQFELTVTDNNGAVSKDTVQVTVNAAPLVNAGLDKLISLPTNATTLSGTATDADGTISSYSWVKISGPSSVTIATANASITAVSNMAQGVYQFELTVTDNSGAVSKDTVQLTVNAAPVANAGTDNIISLPTNNITLTGTATDADGTISNYSWAKISGPSSGIIVTINAATTVVNNLVQGVYQYELTVTDNNGSTGKDTVAIIVNAAPVANAGSDTAITLPANTVNLTGSATDTDGAITGYSWIQISGPSSGTITNGNTATTVLSGLVQGVYQYELTVTDNNGATAKDTIQIAVNALPNVAPIAYAGVDNIITLPTNTVTLSGYGTDADGTVSIYAWVKISGPSSGTIVTPNNASTVLTNLVQGVYQYELTVTDNNGAIGKDTMQLIVNVALNAAPVANAGVDKVMNWPVNTTNLIGSGTDADGTIAKYAWVKIAGPASGKILTSGAAATTINSLVQGIYQYELTVTDNKGTTAKDTVQVIVNTIPVANAGSDTTITLPVNTSILTSSSTDMDGTISKYAWIKISGPATGKILSINAATTVINSLVAGIYKYQLTVTDNNGATAKDTVQVTVNSAPNQAPVSNAGADKMITLPTNNITLTGKGTDADGTISVYSWLQISGPSSGNIASQNAATTVLNGLTEGVYQYELTVTDNSGATAKDTVQVTVNAALNLAPKANAGADNVIVLPSNSATLSGIGTDADGTVTSYGWVKISGPVSGTIAGDTTATALLTDLADGTYQYELTVKDNSGAIGKDTVMISVNAAPVANAGVDKVMNWPVNTTNLIGSGTDADGTIAKYAWVKIAGPASGKILTSGAAATTINSLVQGIYQYELTVTDNKGTTAKDTVQVIVNTIPVANAGSDTTITLPVNTSILTSSSTDMDGTISKYAWIKISGPATGKILSINAATTVINSLVAGIYKYQLTVTDNNGATAKDTVQVTVNSAPNQAPVSNAGADKMITLPTNNITLTGKGTDADGTISVYSWLQISGPSSGNIASQNAATTVLNGLTEGVYQYELTVTDNSGATAKDTVQVTVNAALNLAPKANAGADNVIVLPSNSATLSGIGTDADGAVTSYGWVKISGPVSGTIAGDTTATALLTDLADGTYQYELTVKDNSGAIGKDTVMISVNAAPVANAGVDKVMNWPVNTTNLIGSGTDVDGTIAKYAWVKIAGPASGKILTSGAAATTINSLVQGTYQYELTVTDNKGTTAKDTVQVIVNTIPVANAGSDTTITLPVNSTILAGIGTDADGTVATYYWTKISGPSTGKIAVANAATTGINTLVQGTYTYVLTVTDNNGGISKDTVQVTVNAASAARVIVTEKVLALPVAPVINELKVYPNPVNDIANLNITTNGNTKLRMSVTDMSGRMVKSGEISNPGKNQTFKLNISDLRDGYYIISVTFADGQILNSKVLKYGGK